MVTSMGAQITQIVHIPVILFEDLTTRETRKTISYAMICVKRFFMYNEIDKEV